MNETNATGESVGVTEAQQIRHWDLLAQAWILHDGPLKPAGEIIRSMAATIDRLQATNAEQAERIVEVAGMLADAIEAKAEQAEELERLTIAGEFDRMNARALQAELRDVWRAVVDQCDLSGDYTYENGNMTVWVSCVCCNESWQHDEQPKHREGCVYDSCRQALAADGGEG